MDLSKISYDEGLEMVLERYALHQELTKEAAIDWDSVKGFIGGLPGKVSEGAKAVWADPMGRGAIIGTGVGGGLGLLSSAFTPRGRKRRPISRALTGGLLGGLAGGLIPPGIAAAKRLFKTEDGGGGGEAPVDNRPAWLKRTTNPGSYPAERIKGWGIGTSPLAAGAGGAAIGAMTGGKGVPTGIPRSRGQLFTEGAGLSSTELRGSQQVVQSLRDSGMSRGAAQKLVEQHGTQGAIAARAKQMRTKAPSAPRVKYAPQSTTPMMPGAPGMPGAPLPTTTEDLPAAIRRVNKERAARKAVVPEAKAVREGIQRLRSGAQGHKPTNAEVWRQNRQNLGSRRVLRGRAARGGAAGLISALLANLIPEPE